LSRALGDGGQTLSEKSSCKHENIEKVVRWKCTDCKETFSEDPTKKDAKKK
jgi:transposase-like protein